MQGLSVGGNTQFSLMFDDERVTRAVVSSLPDMTHQAVGEEEGIEGRRVALELYLPFVSLFGEAGEGFPHFDKRAPHGFVEGTARRSCIKKTAAAINYSGHIQLDNLTNCKQTGVGGMATTKSGSTTISLWCEAWKRHTSAAGERKGWEE